jgi:hypothetical protein
MHNTQTITTGHGADRSRFIGGPWPSGRVVVKSLKAKVAVLALSAALAGGVMAAPAFGAAGPNDRGTNCHGVWLSYLSTSDMAPGQLHRDFGASVQDVQATADAVCER